MDMPGSGKPPATSGPSKGGLGIFGSLEAGAESLTGIDFNRDGQTGNKPGQYSNNALMSPAECCKSKNEIDAMILKLTTDLKKLREQKKSMAILCKPINPKCSSKKRKKCCAPKKSSCGCASGGCAVPDTAPSSYSYGPPPPWYRQRDTW
jgi:hypothetical protein